VSGRKPFLLRVEPALLTALERWAADDLRSVNGQIEFLLREALRRAGRKVLPVPDIPGHPERSASDASAKSKDDDEAPAVAENATGRRKAPRGG
jgi:hypothetical protein